MASQAAVLTGDQELNTKLARLKGSQAKEAIRKASREALRPVLQAAKSNAPRRTGTLARSVKIRALRRSRSRIGSQVTSSGTAYGAPQEYGWRAGRRVRNSDLGAAKGAKRTTAQKAAAGERNNARRKIEGTQFLQRAAKSRENTALSIYRAETERWIHQQSKT